MQYIEQTIDASEENIESKKRASDIAKISSFVFVSMYNHLVEDGYLD